MNPMMPLVDRGCERSGSAWAQACPNLVNHVEAMLRGVASDLGARPHRCP